MAKRSATPPPPEPASGIFTVLRQSGLGTLVVVFGLLGGTAWFLWQQVHRTVAARGDYQLDLNEIELPPKPAWIRADVRAEALRDASLDPPLSLLDTTLPERLVKAYSLHPWVSRVEGVKLTYPAHANIKLQYRRPIALVPVNEGLLPIDAVGTLLPTRDFENHPDLLKYPRLTVNLGSPTAPAGTVWENPIIQGGAQIITALEPLWNQAELQQLRWVEDLANVGSITRHYVLETKQGGTLIWGQAPGREHVGELPLADKIAAIKRWTEQPGGLSNVVKLNTLDLRTINMWPK
jgi:hypothetical protein